MHFSSPSSIVRCRHLTQTIPFTLAVSSFPFSHTQTGFSHFLSLIKIMIVKTFQTLYFQDLLVKSSCLQLFARDPQPRELQLLFWFSALRHSSAANGHCSAPSSVPSPLTVDFVHKNIAVQVIFHIPTALVPGSQWNTLRITPFCLAAPQ